MWIMWNNAAALNRTSDLLLVVAGLIVLAMVCARTFADPSAQAVTDPVALSHWASSPSAHRIQRNTSKSWISMSRKMPPDAWM